jgi:environmental stress-induced protein Ves
MPLSGLSGGVHRFAGTSLPAVPWKNGGGTTREVVSQPPGATFDDFDWRVSIATIASDGPFSPFPGVDRTIMLVAGDGVRLTGAGVARVLDAVGEPFAFSGDIALDSTLLRGESTDLNVMTRRARCRAEVVALDGASELEQAHAGLLMSLRGEWRVEVAAGSEPPAVIDVGTHEGIWWSGECGARALAPVLEGLGDRATRPLVAVVRILRRPAAREKCHRLLPAHWED